MPAILGLIPAWAWRWVAIAAIAAAAGGFCWVKGNEHGTEKLTEYIGKQAAEAIRIAQGRAVVSAQVVTHYVAVKAATQVVTQTVEKEVTRYAETNPGSCLDPEWGRLHDAAALNIIPAAAGRVDGPSGTAKATAQN